jgi:hypothetical protein
MRDVDTDVSILYVMVDDFCQLHHFDEASHPGPAAALSCAEVVTLAMYGQWCSFPANEPSTVKPHTTCGNISDPA